MNNPRGNSQAIDNADELSKKGVVDIINDGDRIQPGLAPDWRPWLAARLGPSCNCSGWKQREQ